MEKSKALKVPVNLICVVEDCPLHKDNKCDFKIVIRPSKDKEGQVAAEFVCQGRENKKEV